MAQTSAYYHIMETAHTTKSALHMKYTVPAVETVFMDLYGIVVMAVVKVVFDSHVACS